jgi:hypothetical protein
MPADRRTVRDPRDWQSIQQDIASKRQAREVTPQMRRLVNQYLPVPRAVYTLAAEFENSVKPEIPHTEVLWGLLHLNIKVLITFNFR